MEQTIVPNSFTTATSPNLQPPDVDRTWALAWNLPAWDTVYNQAGSWVWYGGTVQNCGTHTWDGRYCFSGGEDKLGGGGSQQCLDHYVYPGQTWAPTGAFQNTSGNANVTARFWVGSPLWTFVSATSRIRTAWNWTQAEYDVNRGWVNLGSTGFHAETSADSGASWWPLAWNGSAWANANGQVSPVPGGSLVDVTPWAAGWYAVTLYAPFTGCYKINTATIADGDYQNLSNDPNDDGVTVELDDAYWGIAWNIRNRTEYFTDPSGWYDPQNGTGGCFRVNTVGGLAARILVKPRGDKGHDLTRITFQIRAMQDL
jgi:hypothetical protein